MLWGYLKGGELDPLVPVKGNLNEEIKESSPKVLLKPLDNDFLMRLTSVIEENLASKDLDVVFLSHKMCMSQSTLYRKLKGLINISTNEYIRKIRIKKAIELLDSDKYKVTEVMWEVGMSSAVYFRQCFKEELGVFPSEYLKIKDKIVTEKSDTTNNRKFKQICIG